MHPITAIVEVSIAGQVHARRNRRLCVFRELAAHTYVIRFTVKRARARVRPPKSENARKVKTRRREPAQPGDPMSQTRRPNVPTFEYLYARRPLSRILIYRRAKYEPRLSTRRDGDGVRARVHAHARNAQRSSLCVPSHTSCGCVRLQ